MVTRLDSLIGVLHSDGSRRVGLVQRALASGGQMVGPRTCEWNIAGRCLTPVTREVKARADSFGEKYLLNPKAMTIILHCKCRKCDRCLLERKWAWADRMAEECQFAARTWMATFTFSPESRFKLLSQVRLRWRKKGEDFEALPPEKRAREVLEQSGKELTLYFKRLRKNTKVPLRYCLVSEFHADDAPHWHALIHEPFARLAVRHKDLTSTWPHGFTRFKLVDQTDLKKTARYVAKYLAKDAETRVRSSQHYGDPIASHALLKQRIGKKNPVVRSREPPVTPKGSD